MGCRDGSRAISDRHHRPVLFLEHHFYLARLQNGQNRDCHGTRAVFLAVSLPIDLLIRFAVPKLVYNHLGLVVQSQKPVIWHGIHDSRAHLGVPCTVVGLAICISTSVCVHKEPKRARTMVHTHIKPPWSRFVSWPSTSCVGYVTDKNISFGLPPIYRLYRPRLWGDPATSDVAVFGSDGHEMCL